MTIITTFPANKLATTVGATGLRSEVVVPQPRIPIPVEEEVEFEFDQKKYEEYLSSSSRSNSPRRSKKVSAARRTRWASDVEPQDGESNPAAAGSEKSPSAPEVQTTTAPEKNANDVPVLSKRARQRRRQSMARKYAKAMQSTDGIRYEADLRSRLTQRLQPQATGGPSKPSTNEWVRVKRNRSTLQERIRKRRALLAQARALVQQARQLKKEEAVKKPSTNQVWRPKPVNTTTTTNSASKPSFASKPIPAPALKSEILSASTKVAPTPKLPTASTSKPVAKPTATTSRLTIKDRLGPQKESRVTPNAGGRTHKDRKIPATSPTGLKIEVRESAEISRSHRRKSRRVTFGSFDETVRPRKETFSSDDEDVIPERSCRRTASCSGTHVDELYYCAGGTRKSRRSSPEQSCLCSKFIKTVLSECSCHQETPKRVSVFQRLTTETPRPRSRRFRRRSTPRNDELPEVTNNMTGKEPSSQVIPSASQRLTRLRSGTIRRSNYDKLLKGLPSEDEVSDAGSAMASDNTVSSEGQPREALMISAEQVAKMLEEALDKQKENFKFEMDMAMQQMRDMHDQQIQALTNRQGETSRRNNINQIDSDTDGEEDHGARQPPEERNAGGSQENASGNAVLENEKIKDLESKINTLISAQEIKKTGIPCPYPREWESIPYPSKFSLINFTPFDGKGSPTQHLIYFKSHLGVISGNEPLMVRSFVGTLRGAAFDWYRRLKPGSVTSWDDMEAMFLTNFFDDDTEISIGALLDEKQKHGETVNNFVKRFRNKAMNCRDPITEEFILQTCHNNLSLDVLESMGTVPSKTWKDLKVRGEQAERFLKRKKRERGQQMAEAHKQNFVQRGKAADANQTSQLQPQQKSQQRAPQQQKPFATRFPKVYSFKEDEVPGIFKYLLENNKIKLPPIQDQEEAQRTNDPKYCAYHRAVHHPTKACYHLKDKIQALIDVGVITPKSSK